MKRQLDFIKTTAIGGFVFLIPAVIVVIALGKLIGGLKTLAKALSPIFGGESSFGGFVLDIVAFAVAVLLCFAAGLLARRAAAKQVRERLDRSLLNFIPGYAFIKGFADNLRQTEEISGSFVPIMVRFDDYVQMAFETERLPNGKVALCAKSFILQVYDVLARHNVNEGAPFPIRCRPETCYRPLLEPIVRTC